MFFKVPVIGSAWVLVNVVWGWVGVILGGTGGSFRGLTGGMVEEEQVVSHSGLFLDNCDPCLYH